MIDPTPERAQQAEEHAEVLDQYRGGCGYGDSRVGRALRAAIAALRALSAREWQDISSAPKDGSYILMVVDWGVGPRRVVGWWDGLIEGWFATPCVKGLKPLQPTAWMPLPSPPSPIGGPQ